MRPIIPLLFLASAVNAQLEDTRSITISPMDLNGQCSTAPVNQVTFYTSFFSPGIYGVLLLPSSQYQILAAGLKNGTILPVNYYTQYSCIGNGSTGVTSCLTTLLPATVNANETTCLACINSGTTAVTGSMSVRFENGNGNGPTGQSFPTIPSSTIPSSSLDDLFSTRQSSSTAQPMSTIKILGIAVGCITAVVVIGLVAVVFMKRRRQQSPNTDYYKPTFGGMESAPVWPESKTGRVPPPTVPFWAESDTDDLDPGIVVAE